MSDHQKDAEPDLTELLRLLELAGARQGMGKCELAREAVVAAIALIKERSL